MARKRTTVMVLVVSLPKDMTPAQARREVRDILRDERGTFRTDLVVRRLGHPADFTTEELGF